MNVIKATYLNYMFRKGMDTNPTSPDICKLSHCSSMLSPDLVWGGLDVLKPPNIAQCFKKRGLFCVAEQSHVPAVFLCSWDENSTVGTSSTSVDQKTCHVYRIIQTDD